MQVHLRKGGRGRAGPRPVHVKSRQAELVNILKGKFRASDNVINPFLGWIKKHPDVIIRHASTNKPLTHTAMDGMRGGKFSFQSKVIDDCYRAYIEAIGMSAPLCMSELHGGRVFRCFFDIDLVQQSTQCLQPAYWCTLYDIIQKSIHDFYRLSASSTLSTMLVLKRDEKRLGASTSYGIHLIFPHVYVTCDLMLVLRSVVLNKVLHCKQLERAADEKPWSDIIDKAPYRATGALRMPFSVKVQACSQCRSRRRSALCNECDGKITYDFGNFYVLDSVRVGGEVDERQTLEYQHMPKLLLTNSALRPTSVDQTVSPPPPPESKLSQLRSVIRKDGVCKLTSGIKRRGTEIKDATVLANLQQYIRKYTVKQYLRVDVQTVVRNSSIKTQYYTVIPSGPGSGYCMNLGKSHRSANVYFVFTAKGMVQRCFCRCDTTQGRRSGATCKKFRTQHFHVPPALKQVLFPQQVSEKLTPRSTLLHNMFPVLPVPTASSACWGSGRRKPYDPVVLDTKGQRKLRHIGLLMEKMYAQISELKLNSGAAASSSAQPSRAEQSLAGKRKPATGGHGRQDRRALTGSGTVVKRGRFET